MVESERDVKTDSMASIAGPAQDRSASLRLRYGLPPTAARKRGFADFPGVRRFATTPDTMKQASNQIGAGWRRGVLDGSQI